MLSDKSFAQQYLVWPKVLYFCLSLAIYTANGAFSLVLINEWNFSYSKVGFVMAIQGINFVGAIVWTGWADRSGKHKYLLAGATVATSIAFFANNAPKLFKFSLGNDLYDLLYTITCVAIMWFFQSAMFPLLDSAMIGMLSRDPKFTKDQFGTQRLFGCPAHVVGTLLGGFSMGFKDYSMYILQLNSMIASLIFTIAVLWAVPNITEPIPKSFTHHGHKEKGAVNHVSQATALPLAPSPIVPAAPEIDTTSKGESGRSPVVRLLLDPGFLFFMLFVTSAGLLANTLTLFQLAKVGHKKSPLVAATTRIPAAFSEIFVYLTAKEITKKVGIYWLLIFSQLAGLIRMFGYAFIPEKYSWAYYLLEVTKGLNSGFIISAGVRIASDIALPGTSTTAQGLFSGNYKGISFMFAGVIGGCILLLVKENLNRLFMIVGIISSVTTLLFFLKFLLIDRTIGFPGMPSKTKKPVSAHDTASTSSFGSTISDSKSAV